MDYCHSCRRHLNGALACAGCGTPVEALAPAPDDELLVYAGAPTGVAEVPAPPGHRRARKGRRARRKRGKVILFGSAGLVLVVGAVGMVQMAMEPPVEDRASSVQEDQTISDPQPLPSGSAAGVPSKPTTRPVSSKGHARGPGSGPATGAPAPGGATSEPPRDGASPKTSSSAVPGPGPSSSVPMDPASPGASDSPGPGEPSHSEQPPPPPPPPPSPTPTKTCHRFLWWCT
ncbi:SCO2400 family protein [Streptomyces hundungensis]|uniref:SCO2400 family protein n=1 Tax=Streptomyces hundungensis TaxID=1077946 RepID=UPI00340DA837